MNRGEWLSKSAEQVSANVPTNNFIYYPFTATQMYSPFYGHMSKAAAA